MQILYCIGDQGLLLQQEVTRAKELCFLMYVNLQSFLNNLLIQCVLAKTIGKKLWHLAPVSYYWCKAPALQMIVSVINALGLLMVHRLRCSVLSAHSVSWPGSPPASGTPGNWPSRPGCHPDLSSCPSLLKNCQCPERDRESVKSSTI